MEIKKYTLNNQNFTTISKRYKETSLVQSSAAEILFSLLNIQNDEAVLDIGCGTGNLTKKYMIFLKEMLWVLIRQQE